MPSVELMLSSSSTTQYPELDSLDTEVPQTALTFSRKKQGCMKNSFPF